MLSPRSWTVHTAGQPFVMPEPGTLVGAWVAMLSQNPDQPLLHDTTGWVNRGEFLARTERVAGRLQGMGLNPGDRVVISGPSTVDLAVAHVAALRAGLIVVPTNGSYQEPELAHVVTDARPRAALVDHPGWENTLKSLAPELLVCPTSMPWPDHPPQNLDAVTPDSPAFIGYTSGTTGRPKGAMLSQANLLASVAAVQMAWKWTAQDRLLLCLPMFHMHGLGVGLHGTLLTGGSAVLQQGFDPDEIFAAREKHQATMFFGVPTMYHRLASHPRVADLAQLRLCVSGSAPLAAALNQRLAAEAGVTVLERYGMTETVMLVSNPFDQERRPGAVGFPLPGVDLRLDEASNEILVRGPNVFDGYWERPDANQEAFVADPDGDWFRTGDLGAIDQDGYVSIVGRAKELIISGGFNVYPREVDDALAEHPAIAEVAAAGVPSEEWGEEVVAWVVLAEGATAPSIDEVRAFARETLAAYKLPRRIQVVKSLPRNALGKVMRHELRED